MEFYTILKEYNKNFPQKFEILCLEMGEKTSVFHDLGILQLAVQYIKQHYQENINQILDENDKIKKVDQANFIKYITESPNGKQLKINQVEEELNDVAHMKHSLYPLIWLDKEVVDEQMLNYLESLLKSNLDKINILKEQYDENEKKLNEIMFKSDQSTNEQSKEQQPSVAPYKIHPKYNYLKALYTVYYQLVIDKIIKQLEELPNSQYKDININLITLNSSIPYYTKELANIELNSTSVKRILSVLDKKDQEKILNLINVKAVEDIKEGDFI